jgi:RNA polymerase sigma factor (TIGR02999 family)
MGPANRKNLDPDALAQATYVELGSLARRFLAGERANHTLQPTELVHEAWMRIARAEGLEEGDRARFFGLAATTMRHILVDHARARLTDRRAADRARPLVEEPAAVEEAQCLDAIDRALIQLERRDPDLRRIVELRFFGGLTVEETARVVGISPRTVKREWRLARAWLHAKLMEENRGS